MEMKRIAVMSYNIGDIDIITLDKEIRTNKEVEEYLQNTCNYNLDEIYWMGFDKGNINFLTDGNFKH
mgnify:FL=1|jgi:hypothetical protein